jgi:hypothetical protein
MTVPGTAVRCGWFDKPSYEGRWDARHKEGFGVMKLADSSKYLGQFKQGLPHGLGKFLEASGASVPVVSRHLMSAASTSESCSAALLRAQVFI